MRVAEAWRRGWGTEKFFADQDFRMTFFPEKFPFSRPKILMTFFLIFLFFFQILRIFTVLNVIYNPFFTRKTTISETNSLTTPFFTLFVLSRASDTTSLLLKLLGGRMNGPSPPQFFLGETFPQSPLGLRP